jgi:hypothetical protein
MVDILTPAPHTNMTIYSYLDQELNESTDIEAHFHHIVEEDHMFYEW